MESNGWTTAARKLLGKKLDGGLRWWENVGSFSENVNRAALYKQLRFFCNEFIICIWFVALFFIRFGWMLLK